MHWSKWKTDIDLAIAEVCVQITQEPLSYFSEADIQQFLVEKLRRITPLSKLYQTSVPKGKGSKGLYKTPLVHREYGGGGGTRIDIVIFDPEDVREINNVNLTVEKKYLHPAYAFELGTEKTSDAATHMQNDLKKLSKRAKGTGYLIHFYKDITQARSGTKSREKTEARIERDYKQVFSMKQTYDLKNVKILAILLRTYRDQERMRGKCEIYNGDEWIKINVSRGTAIRKAVLKQLT